MKIIGLYPDQQLPTKISHHTSDLQRTNDARRLRLLPIHLKIQVSLPAALPLTEYHVLNRLLSVKVPASTSSTRRLPIDLRLVSIVL